MLRCRRENDDDTDDDDSVDDVDAYFAREREREGRDMIYVPRPERRPQAQRCLRHL